jgi:hypothetical protein
MMEQNQFSALWTFSIIKPKESVALLPNLNVTPVHQSAFACLHSSIFLGWGWDGIFIIPVLYINLQ